MGKFSTRDKQKNRLPPFVPLIWELLNSQAYKDLTPSAGKVLPYFLGKVKATPNAPERHATNFHFPYTEAQKYGFAIGTHHRNISQLMRMGFIDPVSKGGKRSFGMSSSIFKLSTRWRKYGTAGFETIDWGKILPDFLKRKATPKMGTYNIKNGAGEG